MGVSFQESKMLLFFIYRRIGVPVNALRSHPYSIKRFHQINEAPGIQSERVHWVEYFSAQRGAGSGYAKYHFHPPKNQTLLCDVDVFQ